MVEILYKSMAFLGGLVLGSVFFGGLWLTVRKAVTSKIPALWFFGSLILRTGIVLLGFYLVMQRAQWMDGLICLSGFIAGRWMILRITKAHELRTSDTKEAKS